MRLRRFKRYKELEKELRPIDIAPLVDVVFLLLIFFILTSSFVINSGIKVDIPKAITSEMVTPEQEEIVISGEDMIYYRGKAVSLKELEVILERKKKENPSLEVMIKADRLSSLGRTVAVWDICRKVGVEKVNIAARQSRGDY